jgi:chemotaxis protein MotA
MDPGTLAGIGLAIVAILVSMILEGGNPMSILLPPAMLLVFGGTIGAAMAGGMLKDTVGLVGWIKVALLSPKPQPPDELIATLVGLAERARREGLLALEDAIREVEIEYLRRGLELAIDGTDPEELRDILESELEAKRARDKAGAKLFTDMGGYAPTIGIIGTVLGLVHVLENLSNPDQLGHLIAAAFVATLWGVLSANVIWLPLGNKVKRVSELQCHEMELLIEGIMAIQAGANPRMVDQKLRAQMVMVSKTAPAEKAA